MKTVSRNLLSTLLAVIAISFAGSAFAGQPHMEAAISHLEAAKAELQSADANKGGWRVDAIKQIDVVIDQVRNGEKAGRKNK